MTEDLTRIEEELDEEYNLPEYIIIQILEHKLPEYTYLILEMLYKNNLIESYLKEFD